MDDVAISPIEQVIEDARNGLPYILVDAPDRECEGEIVIPAQFVTPRVVNFMATHACGLICLAMTGTRAGELGLNPMTARDESGHAAAFTVSIEAREGVTTGISAHDRAHTIAVAVDPTKSRSDIVSPGHVFPLVARDGGVLVRAGHTEAAVDIARLAGLNPAGVICAILSDDGQTARLAELVEFARRHQLNIGAIADLIAYRRRSETLVERVAEAPFTSHHGAGAFRIVVYRNSIDGGEHVALVRGAVRPDVPTLVRVHQTDLTADILGWSQSARDYVPMAIRILSEHEGAAVAVFVRDPNPQSISERVAGGRQAYWETHAYRDFGIGAQILRDLGVEDMILLTSSARKLAALEGFGLRVVDRRPLGRAAAPTRPVRQHER